MMTKTNAKIKRLMVANRGAIASRIFATCREMGIQTCGIAHELDKNLKYVSHADEFRILPGTTLTETYLNMDLLIETAKSMKVDAIHPGYGFLSENSQFAQKVMDSGIIFIGPAPQVMEQLGNKINAKRVAENLGVPILPGYHGDDQSLENLKSQSQKIGYPLLIKAAAGGGGKGMRVVASANEFLEKLEQAKSEALRSFGNDKVLLEKYLVGPKHIEVQMLCDRHGNFLHLYERDCSIQRRHQKIVEEAPAPSLNAKERDDVCQAAVKLCQGIKYESAGTVEFIYEQGKFYFLEVNTRLQVEHGVSELVTGVDIVREQIRIAEGQPISVSQNEIVLRGHALQVRVYAEDPQNHFFPSAGKIFCAAPTEQKNIRIDATYFSGDEMSTMFDPMMAKVMAVDLSREGVIAKMREVLKDVGYLGVKNNIEYLAALINHQDFRNGTFSTGMIDKHGGDILKSLETETETEANHENSVPHDILYALYNSLTSLQSLNDKDKKSGPTLWEKMGNLRIPT
ncbi:MAG: biotin carboxylase N-terminal domain-containing protein [Bacteriovoracaceae bacterium]|nr:biotin carboxylase N-terminal domain-containing protein [Bacteriovoracaceae bacterium]